MSPPPPPPSSAATWEILGCSAMLFLCVGRNLKGLEFWNTVAHKPKLLIYIWRWLCFHFNQLSSKHWVTESKKDVLAACTSSVSNFMNWQWNRQWRGWPSKHCQFCSLRVLALFFFPPEHSAFIVRTPREVRDPAGCCDTAGILGSMVP